MLSYNERKDTAIISVVTRNIQFFLSRVQPVTGFLQFSNSTDALGILTMYIGVWQLYSSNKD